jgi:RNA recognition motif-containing protein
VLALIAVAREDNASTGLPMSCRIFVRNLPLSLDQVALSEICEVLGEVEWVTLVCEETSRRSKGFCFVGLAAGDEAVKMISVFNGVSLSGHRLEAGQAEPRLCLLARSPRRRSRHPEKRSGSPRRKKE